MPKDAAQPMAAPAELNHVSDDDPGLRRRGAGPSAAYFHADGREIRDPETLARIRSLAIPPAWTRVWISPDPFGHIQAVGRDARGRKQYRYHPLWRASRDEAKYDKLLAFGRALPALRARVERDLSLPGLPRERVLAAVVRILELTFVRVGNREYARANNSFGLTTLTKRHLTLRSAGAVFEYRGKSGVRRRTGFHDRRLARLLRNLTHLRGQRLFQYVNGDGVRRSIESHDVNQYLREAMGEEFSAKDFRTWAGTLLAARALVSLPPPESEAEARKAIATAIKAVAGILGNTAAVCRACYVHPAVLEAYRAGRLSPRLALDGRPSELALLRLLEPAG
ncbi:MAG TPA: DNA topoisomerase IB [Caulobacteraceae bacterium]|nr:DNA topoisomerase IB [Caulobacteraceae bacterium]